MDTGVLNLAWCQGYDGSPLSFIAPDVLCYQCGRNVNTLSLKKKQGTFPFKGSSIGPVAYHTVNKHIAIAEYEENPKIFIYAYPTFAEVAVLEGGADLEYQTIVFSESDFLASISGVPCFKFTLWKYSDGTLLTTVGISSDPVKALSFNKTNWRQICLMTDSNITLWNIEQCNTKYILLPQKLNLPPAEQKDVLEKEKEVEETPERSPTKMSKYSIKMPDSAVAGLTGGEVEYLDSIINSTPRVRPISLTWMPTGDFYLGCEDGQLFKVDTEIFQITPIYYPSPQDGGNPFDRGLTSVSRGETDMPPTDSNPLVLRPGSLQCIEIHQNGLYAAGKDGVVRLLDVSGEEVQLKEEINVDVPVSSLTFNSNYQILVWGSPEGLIQSYTCGVAGSVTTLLSVHHGNVVGVGGLAIGSECSVSLREDGTLQVWKTVDGSFVSSLYLDEPGETLACSRIAQYAAVGTKGGNLCFVDLTNSQKPRLIMRHRLFKQPVKHLVFNGDAGSLLFAASNDNSIFLMDARPTNNFSILGFVTVTGRVQAMATLINQHQTTTLVASCNNNPEITGSNLLYKFVFTDDLIREIRYHYNSPKCDINEEACEMLRMGLRHAVHGLAIGDGEIVFALSASNKKLLSFTMPDPEKKLKKIDLLLSPTAEHPGHQLPGGNLAFSPHLKWLLTYATDGSVKIRTIGALERTAVFSPHEYRRGGVKAVAFSDDCQYILSAGYDGVVSCYHWNHLKGKATTSSAKQKRDRDMDFVSRENQKLTEFPVWSQTIPTNRRASVLELERKAKIEAAKQRVQDADEIYVSPPPSPRQNATWLEQREIDSMRQENETYAGTKYDLRTQIRDIRKTIQHMMAQNRDLPDIEKLGRHEFDLDLEEQNRLQVEGEAEIKKVREDIEFENLAKLYLREKIKEECWDKMKIKGRALQAFNSALEVSNFPLRERPNSLMKLIETVSTRRKIEMREAEVRKQLIEVTPKPTREDESEADEQEEGNKDHPSISGSLGALYGGGSTLVYSQFDLHCREQKINQIVLLEDAIHRIKETFNKEFDEVYAKKEQEISKVKDKNKRIAKIIEYLNLDEGTAVPSMSVAEKPELLLEVAEDEIKVEKYLTPEQKKKLEEERQLEEERLAREKGDNARERALEMMMGGVLEIKKEDELKKDVPKPAFMLTKKEEEYTEEEQKLYKDYLKKVQDLNEEREKFKKQLETELRKLQSTIQENLQAFDDALNVLFLRKIKVMMVIFQEELKILRLRYAMLLQEELEIRERDLNASIEHKRHLKQLAFEAVAETRKNLENFRNEYDNLQAEDKYLDKSFRREFNDVSAVMADLLYKQFKKRPRIQKYRAVDGHSVNPFADRPTSALLMQNQKSQIGTGLDELDKLSHAPEGIDHHVWERMCKLRRVKVESEFMLKIKASTLAEMQSFLQRRQDEDERLKVEIEELNHELSKLKEDEQRFILNLEVQLLLKQGQIEVDAGPFIRDFRESVLVHRSVVEDLNSTIKQLGESKISSMEESKEFRKGIIQLEWEHKKMSMQMEDLENKMKDIQFIKVTREIQAFLQEEDYEAKKAAEVATLEQTIALLKKQHEKNVSEKKRALRGLSKGVKAKGVSNEKLDADLLDLNVVVNERKHIQAVARATRDEGGAERRYQEIVQRRKLVDLAKAQAQEVAVLRAEVERLRMRTFPALVQVER